MRPDGSRPAKLQVCHYRVVHTCPRRFPQVQWQVEVSVTTKFRTPPGVKLSTPDFPFPPGRRVSTVCISPRVRERGIVGDES
jgi:hypothetical protein